jgi:hypothetical protein
MIFVWSFEIITFVLTSEICVWAHGAYPAVLFRKEYLKERKWVFLSCTRWHRHSFRVFDSDRMIFLKYFFVLRYIKIIYFWKIIFILIYQNNLKIYKKINFKQKKKSKILKNSIFLNGPCPCDGFYMSFFKWGVGASGLDLVILF